jgi:hypothetical protein
MRVVSAGRWIRLALGAIALFAVLALPTSAAGVSRAATPASWSTPAKFDFGDHTYPRQMFGVSCPSSSLCVAVDDSGNVLTSTAPTDASTWTVTNVDGTHPLADVSCPTTTLCVAGDSSIGSATWRDRVCDAP